MRKTEIKRKTKETEITLKLNIDGTGKTKINTGIGLLNHMLELFAFWGYFDLEIAAKGDLNIDIHHTNEDVGIVLGQAFKEALKKKIGIKRIGFAFSSMEEVVAGVALDISGRGFFNIGLFQSPGGAASTPENKEGYKFEYAKHFFDAFAKQLGMNLNIKVDYANPDLHATLEPIFKALGIALDLATQIDPRRKGVPSTKGVID